MLLLIRRQAVDRAGWFRFGRQWLAATAMHWATAIQEYSGRAVREEVLVAPRLGR